MRRHMIGLAMACPLAVIACWGVLRPVALSAADEPGRQGAAAKPAADNARAEQAATVWTTAVEPKPISDHVKKGLAWLAEHQDRGGGWGQGEESPNMRGGSRVELRDTPNVADTCVSALAMIRSGSTPTSGPYKDAVAKAVRFVEKSVGSSDSQSISVTTVQGTRVQQKLGPNIDTFMASLLLAEVKGRMGDADENRLVTAALDKVLDKIKRHQKDDGSFDGQGWAPVLAQALCGKGINRARQSGAHVPATVLARAENGAKLAAADLSAKPASSRVVMYGFGSAGASPGIKAAASPGVAAGRSLGRGDAGVELYSRAASVGVLQDVVNTSKVEASQLREEVKAARSPVARDRAQKRLAEIADTEGVQRQAQAEVIGRLGDKGFVAGFGSNGGEEFVSYMNIAESLVVKGGDDWKKWDTSMTANLDRIQNDDGSWTGHHCITGRTFCTATALLVLMADRTPVPVQPKPEAKTDVKR